MRSSSSPNTSSKYGIDQPPNLNPPVGSSVGPPGACMTPSMETWAPTMIFRMVTLLCSGLGRTTRVDADKFPLPRGRLPSAARRRGENRQLSVEGALVSRPRFAAGDIGGEVRVFLDQARPRQSAQHGHHQQVAGAEL